MGGSIDSWNLGDRLIVAALVLMAMLWKERQLKIEGYCKEMAHTSRSASSCASFDHESVAKCNV
jgi:hypothetical protein